MRLLGVETSSAATSAALLVDGAVVSFAWHEDARGHVEALAALVDQVRGEVVPDAVVCGVGPGPYSGLRVGLATAGVLALAWDVPVVGVCSLDAIAAAVVAWRRETASTAGAVDDPAPFMVAVDARRREEYWAGYDASGTRLAGPSIHAVAERTGGPWFGSALPESAALPTAGSAGSGPAGFPVLRYPSAEHVARIAALALGSMPAATLQDVGDGLADQAAVELSAHGRDDGATARALHGRVLLPARPLYVRRPDVHQGKQ